MTWLGSWEYAYCWLVVIVHVSVSHFCLIELSNDGCRRLPWQVVISDLFCHELVNAFGHWRFLLQVKLSSKLSFGSWWLVPPWCVCVVGQIRRNSETSTDDRLYVAFPTSSLLLIDNFHVPHVLHLWTHSLLWNRLGLLRNQWWAHVSIFFVEIWQSLLNGWSYRKIWH